MGFRNRLKLCWIKVDVLLNQDDSDKEHILSTTIYIKSMDHFAEMNEVWASWSPGDRAPARAYVQASMVVREEVLVEISVIAELKQ